MSNSMDTSDMTDRSSVTTQDELEELVPQNDGGVTSRSKQFGTNAVGGVLDGVGMDGREEPDGCSIGSDSVDLATNLLGVKIED